MFQVASTRCAQRTSRSNSAQPISNGTCLAPRRTTRYRTTGTPARATPLPWSLCSLLHHSRELGHTGAAGQQVVDRDQVEFGGHADLFGYRVPQSGAQLVQVAGAARLVANPAP